MRDRRMARYRLVAALVLGIASRAALAAERAPERPEWGTQDWTLTHVGFGEFFPIASGQPYSSGLVQGSDSYFGVYSLVAPGLFYAFPHVPSGALLTYL